MLRATIEATAEIVSLDGVRCRVWRGKTEAGTAALFYVHRIAADAHKSTADLDKALLLQAPPSVREGKADHELMA
jgi:hypothetical protein